MDVSVVIVVGLAAAAVLLGMAYFRRFRMSRPPLGTINLSDVSFVIVAVVVVPYLYLALPRWSVAVVLSLSVLSVLGCLLEPLLRWQIAVWGTAVVIVAIDGVMALEAGTHSPAFLGVNDAVVILVAIGIANLWAQGGLRPQHLAVLAGALTVYDAVATGWLPLTDHLIARLAGLPLLPVIAWPRPGSGWSGIGLGDVLVLTVGPLVLRKAYGAVAGAVAIALGLAGVCLLAGLAESGRLHGTLPTMVVLGPLLVGQIAWWAKRSSSGLAAGIDFGERYGASPGRG